MESQKNQNILSESLFSSKKDIKKQQSINEKRKIYYS